MPYRRHHIHLFGVLFLVALFAFSACDDTTTSPQTTTPDTLLTDGEIMHIALTANQGEVLTSQPAVTKGTHDSVRMFAQQMVTEHTATAQRVQATATTEGITLQTNPISVTLNNSAQGVTAQLNGLSGAAFDQAYMEAQHTMHQNTLNMLDFTLIPRAQDPQVKAFLTEMRTAVAMHLNHARAILRMLM